MRQVLLDLPHDCKISFESGCYYCSLLFEANSKTLEALYKKLVKYKYER